MSLLTGCSWKFWVSWVKSLNTSPDSLTFLMSSKSTPLHQASHSLIVRPSIEKPWHVWYLLKADGTSYHILLWLKHNSFPRRHEDPLFIPNLTHPQSSLKHSEFRRHFCKTLQCSFVTRAGPAWVGYLLCYDFLNQLWVMFRSWSTYTSPHKAHVVANKPMFLTISLLVTLKLLKFSTNVHMKSIPYPDTGNSHFSRKLVTPFFQISYQVNKAIIQTSWKMTWAVDSATPKKSPTVRNVQPHAKQTHS